MSYPPTRPSFQSRRSRSWCQSHRLPSGSSSIPKVARRTVSRHIGHEHSNRRREALTAPYRSLVLVLVERVTSLGDNLLVPRNGFEEDALVLTGRHKLVLYNHWPHARALIVSPRLASPHLVTTQTITTMNLEHLIRVRSVLRVLHQTLDQEVTESWRPNPARRR